MPLTCLPDKHLILLKTIQILFENQIISSPTTNAMRIPKLLRGITRHLALIIFAIIYVALALLTYKDFGITWDEFVDYNKGVVAYQLFFKKTVEKPFMLNKHNGQQDIKDEPDSYASLMRYVNTSRTKFLNFLRYSGLYPMVLFILNKNKSIETYHLLNILFSLGIFIALYILLYHHYRNQKIAILGPLFLFLTPRFLGHIPGNPKDIPFAVMYFISCSAIYFLSSCKNPLTKILIIGLLLGLTQNFRIVAITLYIILILFDIYTYSLKKHKSPTESETWGQFFIKEMQSVILIGIVALLVSVLTWPYLGINVIPNLQELLTLRTNFPWEHTVIYQGKELKGTQLPGHYLVTWLAITTPILILIPALLSPLLITKRGQNRLFVLFLLTIITNMSLYIIIKPVTYDGLRHFLFVVPFVSALGIIAIIEFFKNTQRKIIRAGIAVLVFINVIVISRQIVTLHPYQYIFFNSLVGGLQGAYKKYDTEYWGASYNEAINWFKENIATDKNEKYMIHIWGIKRYKIYQASNIINVNPKIADYIFRFTRRMQEEPQEEDIVHIIKRHNVPLVFITKNNDPSKPVFTKEVRELFKKIPPKVYYSVLNNVINYAMKKGYSTVTKEILVEQLEEMNLPVYEIYLQK
jgi:hypothetical protein